MGSHASTDDRHTSDDQAVCVCVQRETQVLRQSYPPDQTALPSPSLTAASWIEAFLGRLEGGGERKRGARYTSFSGPTQFLLLAVGEDRRIWLVYVFSSPSSVENEAHCDFVKLREMLLR